MNDSLVYFDRALKRLGFKSPKNKILMLIKFLFDLFIVILNLYLPSKKPKKEPTQKDCEIFYLSHKKDETLVNLDPMRLFVENIGTVKNLFVFDFNDWFSGLFTSMGS